MISGRVFILNNHRINEKAVVRQDNRLMLRNMIYTAMFAALTAVCSQIQLPIGAVPFTLQTMGVFIAAGLLGAKKGTLSVGIYILLGAVGIPVFAGFSGGLGIIAGPTGGYIIGFLFTAFAVGILSDLTGGKIWALAVGMITGLFFCYLFGTAWFILVSNAGGGNMDIPTALEYCVIPFLIPDSVKIIISVIIVSRVKKSLTKSSDI